MKLDVIYRCNQCGVTAVGSYTVGDPIDSSPICGCGIEHLTSSMELHTRDETR
jgi:hypothetical protein